MGVKSSRIRPVTRIDVVYDGFFIFLNKENKETWMSLKERFIFSEHTFPVYYLKAGTSTFLPIDSFMEKDQGMIDMVIKGQVYKTFTRQELFSVPAYCFNDTAKF